MKFQYFPVFSPPISSIFPVFLTTISSIFQVFFPTISSIFPVFFPTISKKFPEHFLHAKIMRELSENYAQNCADSVNRDPKASAIPACVQTFINT